MWCFEFEAIHHIQHYVSVVVTCYLFKISRVLFAMFLLKQM